MTCESCSVFSHYLDSLAEEVNDKLQEQGQVTIAELTKTYDLPADFLSEVSPSNNFHNNRCRFLSPHVVCLSLVQCIVCRKVARPS